MLETIERQLADNGIKLDLNKISSSVTKGATDLDLVYSALDNIMAKALEKIYKYSV